MPRKFGFYVEWVGFACHITLGFVLAEHLLLVSVISDLMFLPVCVAWKIIVNDEYLCSVCQTPGICQLSSYFSAA